MLRIESSFVFRRHYASNRNIAEEVKAELELHLELQAPEYADVKITIEEPHPKVPDAMWDPGGMCMMNDEVFSFPLGDIVVKCKAQHFEYFAILLDGNDRYNEVRGLNHPYHKIHGYWEYICISPEEFKSLKGMVKDPEKAVKAREAWDTLQEALSSAGVVEPIKIEDGTTKYYTGAMEKPSLH